VDALPRRSIPATGAQSSSRSSSDRSSSGGNDAGVRVKGDSSNPSTGSHGSSADPRSIRSQVDDDDRQIQQALERDQQRQLQELQLQLQQQQQRLQQLHQQQQQQNNAAQPASSSSPSSNRIALGDGMPALTNDFLAVASNWAPSSAPGASSVAARHRAEAQARAAARADERAQGHRARMEAERHAQLAARAAANPSVAASAGVVFTGHSPSMMHELPSASLFPPVDSSAPAAPSRHHALSSNPATVEVNWAAVQRILNANGGSTQRLGDGGEFTTFDGSTGAASQFASSDLHLNPSYHGAGIAAGAMLSPSFMQAHGQNWQPSNVRNSSDNGSNSNGNSSDDSQRIKAHSASSADRRSASASRSAPASGDSGAGSGGDGSEPGSNERIVDMSMTPPVGRATSSGEDVDSDASRKSSPDHTALAGNVDGNNGAGVDVDVPLSGSSVPAPSSNKADHVHHHHHHHKQHGGGGVVSQGVVRDAVAAAATGRRPSVPASNRQWDPLLSPPDLSHTGHGSSNGGNGNGFGHPALFSASPPLTTSFCSPFSHAFPAGGVSGDPPVGGANGSVGVGGSNGGGGAVNNLLGLPSLPHDSSGSDNDALWQLPRGRSNVGDSGMGSGGGGVGSGGVAGQNSTWFRGSPVPQMVGGGPEIPLHSLLGDADVDMSAVPLPSSSSHRLNTHHVHHGESPPAGMAMAGAGFSPPFASAIACAPQQSPLHYSSASSSSSSSVPMSLVHSSTVTSALMTQSAPSFSSSSSASHRT
jgi:hypothetical protein